MPLVPEVTNSRGDKRLHLIHLGLKGDLPALAKAGNFNRSYARVPRSAAGRCVGICHLCNAGMETSDPVVPFEDFSSAALWKDTYLKDLPFDSLPPIMKGLLWGPMHETPMFFKTDFWHNWHNGLGKTWLSSAFVEFNTSGLLEGRSIDSRFESLTNEYKDFCSKNKISPYLKALSRETFSMESTKVAPSGNWNKAAVTTELMLFLGHVCRKFIEGHTADALLLAVDSRFCSELQNFLEQVLYEIFLVCLYWA